MAMKESGDPVTGTAIFLQDKEGSPVKVRIRKTLGMRENGSPAKGYKYSDQPRGYSQRIGRGAIFKLSRCRNCHRDILVGLG
jgi:hypothetical protein